MAILVKTLIPAKQAENVQTTQYTAAQIAASKAPTVTYPPLPWVA